MKKKKVKYAERMCCHRVLFLLLLQIALMMILRNSTSYSIVPPSSTAASADTNYVQAPKSHEYQRWRPIIKQIMMRRRSSKVSHLSFQSRLPKPRPTITCDRSHHLYDWCHLKRPTILHPTTATFYTHSQTAPPSHLIDGEVEEEEKVRPYPRKTDTATMSRIKEITFRTTTTTRAAVPLNNKKKKTDCHDEVLPPPPPPSSCQVHHDSPALVFSIGGFTGNFFHDFNDGFIPLFITINTLFPAVQRNNITLVISDFSEWWYSKYEAILPQFSSNPIINLDNQTATHCFPSAAAGLITHGPMTIIPELIPNEKSFPDFRSLLEQGYRRCLVWPPPKVKGRPRLVVVSRKGGHGIGRVILNEESLIKSAQEEGFEVVVFKPNAYTYLCDVYRLINSSHAMIGVHGAALTHSLFLRPGAAFIQVVPLGSDWLADKYFKNLGNGMGLEYMEYKITREESSLVQKYGRDHEIVTKAMDIVGHNWSAQHLIYLKEQDVRLDIGRFRGFLKKAYVKAVALMRQQGLRVIRRRGNKRSRFKAYVQPLVFQ